MLGMELSLNSSKERSDTQDLKVVKTDARPSVMTQVTMSAGYSDIFEGTSNEMIEEFHVLQKCEAKWKAFGFDSSVLEIADPWASRNLWFQLILLECQVMRNVHV